MECCGLIAPPLLHQHRSHDAFPELVTLGVHVELVLDKDVRLRLTVRSEHHRMHIEILESLILRTEGLDERIGRPHLLDL